MSKAFYFDAGLFGHQTLISQNVERRPVNSMYVTESYAKKLSCLKETVRLLRGLVLAKIRSYNWKMIFCTERYIYLSSTIVMKTFRPMSVK